MNLYTGIDLAWSDRNESGVALLEERDNFAELVEVVILRSDEEILNYITALNSDNIFVAIDAPLIIPNEKGYREADRIVAREFRRYGAVPFPVNRSLLRKSCGRLRSVELANRLVKMGYRHDPRIFGRKGRYFFEVYPHPAMVRLFGLKEVLRYKKRKRRSKEFVMDELRKYAIYLHSIEDLYIPAGLINIPSLTLSWKEVKRYGDKLDGILCAYIGYICSRKKRCEIYGNMETGYILIP